MPDTLEIDRTLPMDQWSDTQLLGHIQRLTPAALEMVDGMDCTAPARIDHAREEIRLAVDLLQSRGYPFDFAARKKLKFIDWLPTQVDMRMMIRSILQGETLEKGMFPTDYRIEITAQDYSEDASVQFKAMGEIIIAQTLRLGTDQKDAARILIDQIPRAIHTGKFEIPLRSDPAMWKDLSDHLKKFPGTNISLRCTIAQCKDLSVNIKDLIENMPVSRQRDLFPAHEADPPASVHREDASTATAITPKPRPTPWYLRLLGMK
jgi:hypothetical protein